MSKTGMKIVQEEDTTNVCNTRVAMVTRGYWMLSRCYEGHTEMGGICVGDALAVTSAAHPLDPNRLITRKMRSLEIAIVVGDEERDQKHAS